MAVQTILMSMRGIMNYGHLKVINRTALTLAKENSDKICHLRLVLLLDPMNGIINPTALKCLCFTPEN